MTPETARLIMAGILVALLFASPALGCTTLIVTPGATVDGSMYVGHTNDGFGPSVLGHSVTDEGIKVIFVPPADHPAGAERAVHFDPNSGSDEPSDYVEKMDEPLGYIPEAAHTYGYLTASYGIMNEKQLMAGECTDNSKIQPEAEPGARIFYSSELSNIALERNNTALGAVEMVGALIDAYGYYGTGETLLFADPEEAWVIEMCGGTIDGLGGLWAAKKVPDGEIFVASNTFRIREVDPADPDIRYSENLFEVAEKRGWWSPENGTLDWLETVSYGEYSHPYYSLSRLWSVYNRIAPSKNFSPFVEGTYTKEYPFSVKPDSKLDTSGVLALFRDHYEGTVFDLTTGDAAGPFGNPYRWRGPFDDHGDISAGEIKPGAWPRPVSAFFCSYSYLNQGRSWLPDEIGGFCWYGPAQPSETCYIPLYPAEGAVPEEFSIGNRSTFDRGIAWWAFNLAANWATLRYDLMIRDINAAQHQIEGREIENLQAIDEMALAIRASQGPDAARRYLAATSRANAESVVDGWWALADRLVVTYSNAMVNNFTKHESFDIGYPDTWLENNSYQYGPRVYSYEELQEIPDLAYVNETVYTTPGNEIDYIREHQRKTGEGGIWEYLKETLINPFLAS